MKLTKKFMATVLTLCLSLSLVLSGCGGGKDASSAGTESSKDASTAESEVSVDSTAEGEEGEEEEAIHVNPYAGTEYPEGTPITIWSQSFGDKWLDHFELRVHEYNLEGRGYTISEEFIAGAAWDERITAARASGTCPDIYIQSYNHIPAGIKSGYYAPFNDYLDKAIIDDMLPIIKDMVSFDGKTYAAPLLSEPSMLLYYRKDLLEQGGYKEAPKSWDELLEMSNALKTDDVFGLGIPNWGGEISWSTWGMQFGNVGHGPINDNWDAPTIDDGYKDMALFFKDLYDTGAVPEQPLSGYTDIKPFGQGDYVFQICGSWAISDLIDNYADIWENTGVVPVPTKDGNLDKTTATIGGWVYVLDAQAENAEGACDYLSWLLDKSHPERMGEYYEKEHFAKASPYQGISEWAKEKSGGLTYVDTINEVASHGQPEAAYLWDISARVGSLFEDVAMGYDDIDNAMQTCADDIQQLIDDNQIAGTNPRK